MHVIFVVQAAPNPVGHGSNHRAYQVAYDLKEAIGEDQVTLFDYGAELRSLAASRTDRRLVREQIARLPTVWGERLDSARQILRWRGFMASGRLHETRRLFNLLLGGPRGDHPPEANRTLARYNDPRVLARYFERVATLPRPLACVVRHSNFARLAWANRRLGIRTIACPANLEAFDVGVSQLDGTQRAMYLTALNFGDELAALAACDARLFISRVECGLVNGLGFPSHYYPYRPVGAIREEMLAVRRQREERAPTPGLFLMIGSGDHSTTRDSFRWFLRSMAAQPLPNDVRIIVCGRKTDTLAEDGVMPVGVELRGWVEQEELAELLACVQGVLLPQHTGFGGLTRLAELSCAGVPAIVSAHATHAVQPMPPGFTVVDDTWAAWSGAIRQSLHDPMARLPTEDAYALWEQSHTNPWEMILSQWI